MAKIECQCCGHVLDVPPELHDDAGFTCGHCGLILRNSAGARAFRWTQLDPYVRRHGVSRANLWGSLLGALAWLPALVLVMVFTGHFDLILLVALAAPYLVILAVLRARRARTPALVWMMEFWAGLGAYLIYLSCLQLVLPQRVEVLFALGRVGPATAGTLGGMWLLIGLVGRWWYRRRAARLPCLFGQPPAV